MLVVTCTLQGFCVFNSIAIGAAYARAKKVHSPSLRPLCGTTSPILCLQSPNGVDIQGAKRVAIFDFDVHHGNGTEAIVRNLHPSRVVKTIQVPGGMLTTTSIMYKPWVDNKVTPHTALCIQQYCAYALTLALALARGL